MKPKRINITERICSLDVSWNSPECLASYFQGLHEEHSKKYHSLSAKCDTHGCNNDCDGMVLDGTRLETDDEYNKRISKVKETKVKEKLSAMEKVLKLMKQNKLTVDDLKKEFNDAGRVG